jgi:uncharacterized protein YlzI (FlbEa/FlbD family)
MRYYLKVGVGIILNVEHISSIQHTPMGTEVVMLSGKVFILEQAAFDTILREIAKAYYGEV